MARMVHGDSHPFTVLLKPGLTSCVLEWAGWGGGEAPPSKCLISGGRGIGAPKIKMTVK